MGFWFEDAKGRALQDYSATYLRDWSKAATPKLKKFLDSGKADEDLIKAIVKELKAKPKSKLGQDEKELIKLFSKAKPPIIITGGD